MFINCAGWYGAPDIWLVILIPTVAHIIKDNALPLSGWFSVQDFNSNELLDIMIALVTNYYIYISTTN